MDMDIITRVKEQLDYKLTRTDVGTSRALKHAKTRLVFFEMVKLNGVDSLDLFDCIHQCFEEHSFRRPIMTGITPAVWSRAPSRACAIC